MQVVAWTRCPAAEASLYSTLQVRHPWEGTDAIGDKGSPESRGYFIICELQQITQVYILEKCIFRELTLWLLGSLGLQQVGSGSGGTWSFPARHLIWLLRRTERQALALQLSGCTAKCPVQRAKEKLRNSSVLVHLIKLYARGCASTLPKVLKIRSHIYVSGKLAKARPKKKKKIKGSRLQKRWPHRSQGRVLALSRRGTRGAQVISPKLKALGVSGARSGISGICCPWGGCRPRGGGRELAAERRKGDGLLAPTLGGKDGGKRGFPGSYSGGDERLEGANTRWTQFSI